MNTGDWVAMLATGAGAEPLDSPTRRHASAMLLGTSGAALVMAIALGVRADLGDVVDLPMFWVKIAFTGSLAAASLPLALRLSRPGARLSWLPALLPIPVLAMWTLAAVVLTRADPALRVKLFLGETWNSCPLLIAMLSVPLFIAVFWAMRGLAPTRLRLAGTAAGLLAGSAGALVYCLHCPEMEAPFVGFWYLLGMLIPTAVGALAGPRWLQW